MRYVFSRIDSFQVRNGANKRPFEVAQRTAFLDLRSIRIQYRECGAKNHGESLRRRIASGG
jgi:hypothetical protein